MCFLCKITNANKIISKKQTKHIIVYAYTLTRVFSQTKIKIKENNNNTNTPENKNKKLPNTNQFTIDLYLNKEMEKIKRR